MVISRYLWGWRKKHGVQKIDYIVECWWASKFPGPLHGLSGRFERGIPIKPLFIRKRKKEKKNLKT